MFFREIYTDQLAQASYLIACQQTGQALVVDPNRDVDSYLELAAREGLRITAVTETHIHADFVSGARDLAARAGARLYLSGAGPAEWRYTGLDSAQVTLLRDEDHLDIGRLRLDVRHMPGHTPESLSLVLTDTATTTLPMGVFTGDTLFVGDVGRPDLLEKAAGHAGTARAAARDLYGSLHRFADLPEYVQVWPGHGAGSACGKALGAVPQSTLGYERRTNWAFEPLPVEQFVEAVLAGQPDPPPYFARMKRVNKEGLARREGGPLTRLDDDEAAHLREGTLLAVDIRPAAAYAAGHVPGSMALPLGPAFLTWAGWLLPPGRPLALVGSVPDVETATRLLMLIGLDDVAGYWTPDLIPTLAAAGQALATVTSATPAQVAEPATRDRSIVVDVRTAAEHGEGHIAGSLHIPLGLLRDRIAEIPTGRPVVVHCQGGLRSAIAAGLLSASGRPRVVDLEGGFAAWQRAGLPVETADGRVPGDAPHAPVTTTIPATA